MTDICVIRAPASQEVNKRIDWQLKTACDKPEVLVFTFRAGEVIYERTAKAWYLSRPFSETWLFGQKATKAFEKMLALVADVQAASEVTVADFTESESSARQAVETSGLKVLDRSDLFR